MAIRNICAHCGAKVISYNMKLMYQHKTITAKKGIWVCKYGDCETEFSKAIQLNQGSGAFVLIKK